MIGPDDLPGPSLGKLRAASANMMVATLAASLIPCQRALRDAMARQDYLVRAQTVGVGPEEAERVLAEIAEDRATRGLPLQPSYELALAKVCGFEEYVSPERKYLDSRNADQSALARVMDVYRDREVGDDA